MLGLSLAVSGFLSSWLMAPYALEHGGCDSVLQTQQTCSCFGDFEAHLPLISLSSQFLILSALAPKGSPNPVLSPGFHRALQPPLPSVAPLPLVHHPFSPPSHFVRSTLSLLQF